MQPVDRHFIDILTSWSGQPPRAQGHVGSAPDLQDLFDAQVCSRHVDFTARELQQEGRAFYTIGSAGHEANAAVAMALRPSDPALLHYRSGAFFVARAMQVPGHNPVEDLLASLMCSTKDPISGGRHKVIGHPNLAILPQTSTIASHLPRAVGMAFTIDRGVVDTPWPKDAVVVASIGDASLNHSTALGALNAAGYLTHQGAPVPLLTVCEDNGIGISVPSPKGWTARALQHLTDIEYFFCSGHDSQELLATACAATDFVRTSRRPAVLHLETVRFMGHAGSDVELAYRSNAEIQADYDADPLLITARSLVDLGVATPQTLLQRYEEIRSHVLSASKMGVEHLCTAAEVMSPLQPQSPREPAHSLLASPEGRAAAFAGQLPEAGAPMTLAMAINATLTDLMAAQSGVLVFGEDVARKGGVYGVTRGLRSRFGARRIFDTLLDEQTVLGTALGAAVCGALPIPEIQYLAYLHNAEDQLRGEAATLRFFSNGQYENGMVVRIPGLAYQRGFGGHFHNDNSLAVLRDIPGLVLGVPARAADAPGMLRTMASLALSEGRVCVFVEPIAIYHSRDLHDADGAWLAHYSPTDQIPQGVVGHYPATNSGQPGNPPAQDTLIVTFGNGLPMSLRARDRAANLGIQADVIDLRWLVPLPIDGLIAHSRGRAKVIIADETRRSGGVAESVAAALVDHGFDGQIIRLNSEDSIIPLGPAANTVLLSEDHIFEALMDRQERLT